MASLARVIGNTIDVRIGSGKEELMNYFSEWCELKQGELESMLTSIANMTYEHNDVNKNISEAAVFVKLMTRLFGTLSRLEFIGKHKEIIKEVIIEKEKEKERRTPLIIKIEQDEPQNEFPKSSNKPGLLS